MLSRLAITILFLASGPLSLFAQRETLPPEDLEVVQKTWPNAKKTSTGIRYVVLAEGKGDLVKPGNLVSVTYTGWLLDGTVFDKSGDQPLSFRVARSAVIEGWDQVMQLMRPGEKRLVVIPYELAYGSRGQPPTIPPKATLVFEIQLVEVKK